MFVLILLFENLVATLASKPEFLVAKEKMLVALVTVSVAISSPGYDKKFVIGQYPCLITTEPPTAEVYVFGDKMTKYGKKKQQ